MADYLWKEAGFRIAGAGTSVLTDISSYVNTDGLQSAITDLDTTGLGSTSHSRVNGLPNITIPLNGRLNSTTEGIFGPIVNGTSVSKRFEYKVKASTRYYTGTALPTAVQFSGNVNTLQLFSCTLVVTGALTRTSTALA